MTKKFQTIGYGNNQLLMKASDLVKYVANTKENEIALVSKSWVGDAWIPSKKTPYLRLSFGWFKDFFKKPKNSLRIAQQGISVSFLILDKSYIADDILKKLDEVKK